MDEDLGLDTEDIHLLMVLTTSGSQTMACVPVVVLGLPPVSRVARESYMTVECTYYIECSLLLALSPCANLGFFI